MIRPPARLVAVISALLLWAGGPPAAEESAPAEDPVRESEVSEKHTLAPTLKPQLDVSPDIGHVTGCQIRSPFIAGLRVSEDAMASTSTAGVLGFNILTLDPDTGRTRPLVHDTWKSAGNLGQFTYDRHGNIYLVPVPLTSLEVNPPVDQNKVYVIDASTGRMRELVDLPVPKPIDTTNPFGTIGLAYDCETHSLYVSSLAGSGPIDELGTVFRIGLDDGQIKSRLDGVDALGIGVFRGERGKRLYIGSARRPEVLSVALDGQGNFDGGSRLEFNLGAHALPGNFRVQKIRFTSRAEMQIKALPFAYSLRLIESQDIATRMLRYLPGDRWGGG